MKYGYSGEYGFAPAVAEQLSTLNSGLEAFWKMEETGNVVRADATDNGRNLTSFNSPLNRSGVVGNSCDFNGSNQWLRIDKADLDTAHGQTDFTFAGWFASEITSSHMLVAVDRIAGGTRCWHLFKSANFRLTVSSDGTTVADTGFVGSPPSDGTWFHVAVVWDKAGNEMSLYYNGSLLATVSPPGTGLFDSTAQFSIGAIASGGSYLNGGVDAAGVWSRQLTTDEIAELYNAGSGKEYPF